MDTLTVVKKCFPRSIILLKLIQIHINRNPKPQLKLDQKNIILAGDNMLADSANERGDTDDTVDIIDLSTATDISGSDIKPSESDLDSSDCDDDDVDDDENRFKRIRK